MSGSSLVSKDLAGTDVLSLELAPHATVADLRRHLAEQIPALAALLERSALAVNQEFARDEQPLTNDVEVGCCRPSAAADTSDLVPTRSVGTRRSIMIRLINDVIDYHALTELVHRNHCGAVVTFLGTVRT